MDGKGSRRTYLKVVMNLGIVLALILLCIFVVPRVVIYFMPFVIGWIIALIASPLVRFFERQFKVKRKAGSAFVIISVIALVILAGYFLGMKLTEQVADFVREVPEMWESTQQDFAEIGHKLENFGRHLPEEVQRTFKNITENVDQYFGELMGTLSTPTIEALSRFAKNLPSIIIGIIMSLLSAYFFVADKDYVPNLLSKAVPESILERWDMVKRGLKRAVGGYFKAQLKIELWMYVLLAVGFWILRVKYAFIIAVGVAFLDLLPFFGTGTVLLPWAAVKFLSGDYTMVIGLLIIWGVGQLARQLIQPKIVGESVGLSPIPTLFLLFIGFKAGGVVGIIIAVPLGIIVLNMYEEGVFDNTLNSLKVLYASISNFRHLDDKDMESVRIYRQQEQARRRAGKPGEMDRSLDKK
ncbi:sodium-lithium/proton antiporter [Lachnospiraceae bacterium]|jgi:sporulation integral membrane protein YtvI|nr:sporulation integral membrane protein YtvI [Lachnospiraceae bacterium]GFI16655.1 sodium-lithium/proton antiporter [Lachnospiraceae bacterium]GFI68319.1 sodium-lithium/proton antiporter [Lachnospiraceae bacterium]